MNYSTDHYTVSRTFWDGKKDKTEAVFINDDGTYNDEGIKLALDRAWRDLTARTLKRTSEEKDLSVLINEDFVTYIKEWFNTDLSAFSKDNKKIRYIYNKWHLKICRFVLSFLNKHYEDRDDNDKKVKYGKAQKVVNMTMKGLYCMKGADKKEAHFIPCHVALDSFTLEWFARNVIEFEETRELKIYKSKIHSWSKLSDKRLGDYYGYYRLVTWIYSYFDSCPDSPYKDENGNKLTPFQAEFYIWQEMKIHLGAEAFYFAISDNANKDEFKRKSIEEKKTEIRKELSV